MWNCAKSRRLANIEHCICTRVVNIWTAMLLFFLVLPATISLTGCQGCSGKALATLVKFEGPAERDHASAQNKWHPAKKGEQFFVNDGIRTRNSATAELWLRDGSGLRMQQNSLIRFSKTRPGQNQIGLRIEEGVIFIDASSDQLEIKTRYGVAVLEKGTRVKLTRSANGVVLDVQIGNARFIAHDENEQFLSEGQRLQITMEKAVLIPADESDNNQSNSAAVSEEKGAKAQMENADSSAADSPGVSMRLAGNEDSLNLVDEADQPQPHLVVTAGGATWIHSVSAPVNVAIRFADICPHGGAVKLSGTRITYIGSMQAVVPLRMGKHRYQIFCAAENQILKRRPDTSGMLQLVKDQGKVSLALTPPVSTILMDGRTWNVNYQSRLPAIRVKWPSPPEGKAFKLYVSGEKTQKISLSRPVYLFKSGKLKEGTHTIKFIEESSGVRSRSTTLRIQFDNVSDKAALTEPREEAFATGETVAVSGTAMPGWNVNAPGGNIAIDSAGRFEGSLQHNPAYLAVWLRLSHPLRGIHYYLRRASSR